ncbi:MAG: hypothetical protein VKI81_10075 [Synechococcaceae cyanobacterium]|nr:hypothetical protein [Synechococcaceae cyanobacterium]
MRPSGMRFRGRSVVTALLLGSGVGAFLALLFRIAVRNTPVVVNPRTFFWWLILLSASGAVAGMALESVRQLQASSSDPAYHRRSRRRPPPDDPGEI